VVKSLNLIPELAFLDDVPVELVAPGDGCEFRPQEGREWVEEEPVDDQTHDVEREGYGERDGGDGEGGSRSAKAERDEDTILRVD
jgi:hypothetical protein